MELQAFGWKFCCVFERLHLREVKFQRERDRSWRYGTPSLWLEVFTAYWMASPQRGESPERRRY
jgi:hypothetical protein